MNDLIGILLPMLMSGSDIGEIIRTLGGLKSDAASMDGLMSMLNTQQMRASYFSRLRPDQDTIDRSVESIVDRIGINPYSGFGQGMTSLIGSAYHFAPDTLGAILGVPNGAQFFRTIANGSAGISQASGGGTPDIFNPYSMLDAHKRTMEMARQVYDISLRKDGGYDVDFGHGLNMKELGQVTQRMLSSELTYKKYVGKINGELDFSRDTGERLDPNSSADADQFRDNLKKLGAKFNEAASMLSKVTGSVKEALNVMDRLGGGNFLGGTAAQATEVANKAKKMATAIRITSAIAGISPQETYANLVNLQQSMAAGMGLSPDIASASGATGLMQNMAYNGTMAFNAWAAMNPDATIQQRQQALFSANGRAQAYANSNGAALAAAVADNANLFTPEELEQFKTSYREGRPNDMAKLIRQRIGVNMYTEYMTDPAMQLAARRRASEVHPELLNELDQAGEEGNLAQAEKFGASRLLSKTLSDMDTKLTRVSGKSGFAKNVDAAVKTMLQKRAVEQGLQQESVEKMSADDLRRFLKSRPGASAADLEHDENTTRVREANRQIDALTMTDEDDKAARNRLKSEISANTDWSPEAKRNFMDQLDRGQDLNTVYDSYVNGLSRGAANGLRERVFNGKITASEASREREKLKRLERAQKTDYTAQERLDAIENRIKKSNLENIGAIRGLVFDQDFGKLSDRDAMSQFASNVQKLRQEGKVNVVDDNDQLDRTYGTVTQRIVSKMFDGKLGNLEGHQLTAFESDVSQQMMAKLKSGEAKTLQEAFTQTIAALPQEKKDAIGVSGMQRLNEFVTQAKDKNSEISKGLLSQDAFLKETTNLLLDRTPDTRTNARAALKNAAIPSGPFSITSGEAMKQFAANVGKLREAGKVDVGGDNEQLDQTFGTATQRIVSRVFGGNLGDLKGDALKTFESDFSQKMLAKMRSGEAKTVQEAFTQTLAAVPQEQKVLIGTTRLNALMTQAQDPNSAIVRDHLNQETLLETTSDIIAARSPDAKGVARQALQGALSDGSLRRTSGEAMKQFAANVGKLREAGKVDVGGDNEQLDQTFGTAAQRVVSRIFGDKLGNLEGKELTAFETDFSQKMLAKMRSGEAKTVQEAFTQTIGSLTDEQRKALGDDGVKTLDKFNDRSADKASDVGKILSDESFFSSSASVLDEKTRERRTSAVREMRKIASGDFGGLNESQAVDRITELSRMTGVYSGNTEDASAMKIAAIDRVVGQNVKLSGEDRTKVAKSAQEKVDLSKGKIGYGQAIAETLQEMSNVKGISADRQKELRTAAEKIGSKKDIGKDIVGSVLGKIAPNGQRVLGFEATTAAGDINQAALVMAAASARMAGLDLSTVNFGPGSEDFIAKLDKINADTTQNRIPNAIRGGGASYYREAVKDTKAEIENLRKALTEGGVNMETLKTAFGTGPESDEARKKVETALKNNDGTKYDVSHGMSMLKTLQDHTIGKQNGLDALFSEDVMKKAEGDGGADSDLVDITKKANREDSDAAKIMGDLSTVLTKVSEVFKSPEMIFKGMPNPLPVTIKNEVPVSTSPWS